MLWRARVDWNRLAPAGGVWCMENNLTGKQRLFVQAYLAYGEPTFLNATQSAKKAGYVGKASTLSVVGHENLVKPKIRGFIDAYLHEQGYNTEALIRRWLAVAEADISPYVTQKGLKVEKLKEAGLGFLIKIVRFNAKGDAVFDLRDPERAEEQLAKARGMFVQKIEQEIVSKNEILVAFKNDLERAYKDGEEGIPASQEEVAQ